MRDTPLPRWLRAMRDHPPSRQREHGFHKPAQWPYVALFLVVLLVILRIVAHH
jgi:hypothetical protein